MHALFFSGGDTELIHTGSLLSTTKLIPDWFDLDLGGQRVQGIADPYLPANTQYLFATNNLADYTSGFVKPSLRHTFRLARVEASYMRGISSDQQLGVANPLQYKSNQRSAVFNVSSVEHDARVTWTAGYQRQQVDYEQPNKEQFRYENASAELGVLVAGSVRLVGRGGKESDPQLGIDAGGLGSTYWAGGFDWSPGPRDELRLLVGHRFFGKTYEGLWKRQSRLLNLEVTYHEQPTTQDSMLLGQPLTPPVVVVPGTNGFTRLSQDVFLDKLLSGAATVTGRITQIGISVTSEQRSYYSIGGIQTPAALGYEDTQRAATLFASRRLGPLMELHLSGSVGRVDLREAGQNSYNTQQVAAALTRRMGRRASLYMRAQHTKQSGQTTAYKVDLVSVGVNMTFGTAPATGAGATENYGQ
jgi:hypothetical protein